MKIELAEVAEIEAELARMRASTEPVDTEPALWLLDVCQALVDRLKQSSAEASHTASLVRDALDAHSKCVGAAATSTLSRREIEQAEDAFRKLRGLVTS